MALITDFFKSKIFHYEIKPNQKIDVDQLYNEYEALKPLLQLKKHVFTKQLRILLEETYFHVFQVLPPEKGKIQYIATNNLTDHKNFKRKIEREEEIAKNIDRLVNAIEISNKNYQERNEFLKALEEKILPLVMNHTK